MGSGVSFPLRTERLVLREAAAGDLDGVRNVFSSNPEFLELRPEIAAAGGYDLDAVRRYWEGAQLDPVRYLLVICEAQTDETIGIVDFVTESPADGFPWIGLVVIGAGHQRRKYAAEVLAAVGDLLVARGHSVMRMAVIEGDETGVAFAHRAGFETLMSAPTAWLGRRALLMEYDLSRQRGAETSPATQEGN